MPARFKKSGTYYVSQWGGSSLNAGTAEAPFAHPNDLATATVSSIVLGTGVYKGGISALASGQRILIGDGDVIVDLQGGNLITPPYSGLYTENIHFRNVNALGSTVNVAIYRNNIYENVSSFYGNYSMEHRNCVFFPNLNPINLTGPGFGALFYNCMLMCSMSPSSLGALIGNYIPRGVVLSFNSLTNWNNSTLVRNNCINGQISILGTIYESKLNADGTPRSDANPAYLDLATLNPNFYTTAGNYSCEDDDVEILDLKNRCVSPSSHLLKKYDGGFVGGVRPAKFISLSDPQFQVTYTRIDTTNPTSVVVQEGEFDGTVRMTGKISNSLVSSTFFAIRSIMQYWNGVNAPNVENNNVPDAVKTLNLLASEIDKPRRLTYLMRTSQDATANQASSSAIWDNDGGTPGEYLLFEANTVPAHIGGVFGTLGNGDPRVTGGLETPFNFRAVDIIFMLDNNRD
jgi:hypothetical protein